MRKFALLVLIMSCTQKKTSVQNPQIQSIDSLTAIIDSVFKEQDVNIADGIIEHFDSHGYYFNKSYPYYLKYSYHGHKSTFIDTNFYYFNKRLVKISMSEKTDQQATISSDSYYFDNDTLINESDERIKNVADLKKSSEVHLSKLLESHKLEK